MITGVPTSITAFVGQALRGPVDTPVTVASFAEFERIFGGLWADSHLGYSVSDFFRQGGSAAIVVRVHGGRDGDTATLTVGTGRARLRLAAASPGTWASQLTAVVDVAGSGDPQSFDLKITDPATGAVEEFRDVSLAPGSARRVDLVVDSASALVRVQQPLPTRRQRRFPARSAVSPGHDTAEIAASDLVGDAARAASTGLYALEKADLFNLLVIPPYHGIGDVGERDVEEEVITAALDYAKERRAVVVLDPPSTWRSVAVAEAMAPSVPSSDHATMYFPRIQRTDPLRGDQVMTFAPSGAVAGLIARTDATKGVWKAPAGTDATLSGVSGLTVAVTDVENARLNPLAVNCLRTFAAFGHVVWGARTREGADRFSSEWKYVPVRRTALFLQESISRGLQWAVFESNDEASWAKIRSEVGAFLHSLFRDDAFPGSTPRDAYFVRCDAETTTPADIEHGITNVVVGFAPLKPAEFTVLRLTVRHLG